MSLIYVITELIDSKRESDYWDFKREPHTNNADLLHDILSLSNSLHRGDRYLILGVSDPKQGTEIIGLTKDQVGRKTQVEYIDFLRSQSFAGDCRPEVELRTIEIFKKELDVLIILNKPSKPYYINKDYKVEGTIVKANYIYTRTIDTNTPTNRSADIGVIERMWKQRFGLDLTPIERMKLLLLRPNEWFKDLGNKPYAYHLDFPEFRIVFSKYVRSYEVFGYFYNNYESYIGKAIFKYHSTTLFEIEYMCCDGGLLYFSVPEIESFNFMGSKKYFYYYNLEDLKGIFMYFLTDGFNDSYLRGGSSPYVIFGNKEQLKKFRLYLEKNEECLNKVKPNHWAKSAKERLEKEERTPAIDPIFVDRVVQLHKKRDWA